VKPTPRGRDGSLVTSVTSRTGNCPSVPNKQIGAQLYLSPRTVSTHLYRIYPKLEITSRASLRDALAGALAESPHTP
jgi:hypothetical protein